MEPIGFIPPALPFLFLSPIFLFYAEKSKTPDVTEKKKPVTRMVSQA